MRGGELHHSPWTSSTSERNAGKHGGQPGRSAPPLLVSYSQIQAERRAGEGHRRGGSIMLEEVEQHIDGETAEEVDAVGAQEGGV